jgi:hypothetical protein
MRLPSPSYREYINVVATVLVTMTVVEYVGVSGPSGDVDATSLVVMALTLPICIYLLSVAGENIASVPEWDEMVQNDE